MDKFANLFQRIEMKLDDIEELVDELENEFNEAGEGESVNGIRNAIGKLWDEINNIS
jgi:archaellum component FlaC